MSPIPDDLPPLPAGDVIPSLAELADLLASTFPAGERDAARAAFIDEILPWDTRSLAGHPQPRRYLELVYQGLGRALGTDPAQRTARLGAIVCDRGAQRLTDRIGGLAIARYLRGRKGPRPASVTANDLEISAPFTPLTDDAFAAEVARAATDLAVWEERARADHPACLAARRVDIAHARFALDNARTGHFDAASGYLYGFLHRAGERPREIGVH